MFLSSVFKVTLRPDTDFGTKRQAGTNGAYAPARQDTAQGLAETDAEETQEERNNGVRAGAAERRQAEWCMVVLSRRCYFCADIPAGIVQGPMQGPRQNQARPSQGF